MSGGIMSSGVPRGSCSTFLLIIPNTDISLAADTLCPTSSHKWRRHSNLVFFCCQLLILHIGIVAEGICDFLLTSLRWTPCFSRRWGTFLWPFLESTLISMHLFFIFWQSNFCYTLESSANFLPYLTIVVVIHLHRSGTAADPDISLRHPTCDV